MSLFEIVFNQVVLMFMLMLAGGISYKMKWINEDGVRQISNLLLFVINPMTMIGAYQTTFTMDKLQALVQGFIVSNVVLIIGIFIISHVFKNYDGIEKYGLCFSNCGFMGIPIIKAVLGDGAVFYLSSYLVAVNLIVWTYGIYLVTHDKSYFSIKKAILNPGTISVLLGLIVFFSPVKLPPLLYEGVNTLGNLNTPLAMIVLGSYIAKMDLKELVLNVRMYMLSFIRLIVYPLGVLLLFIFLPEDLYIIKMTVLIASMAPAAVNTMIFAIQFDGDSKLGAGFVSLSSLLSLFTMPVILGLTSILW